MCGIKYGDISGSAVLNKCSRVKVAQIVKKVTHECVFYSSTANYDTKPRVSGLDTER